MSMNLIALLYLVASVFFIQALKGLSHPTTSIRGNLFGMTGMTIAVLTTIGLIHGQVQALQIDFAEGLAYVLGALVVGGGQAGIATSEHLSRIGLSHVVLERARIAENCFYSLEAPVLRVGGFDTPYPPAKLEEAYLPDADRILEAIDRSMAY